MPPSQVTTLSGSLAADQLSSAITRQLNDTGSGALHLVDAADNVQDLVGWGTSSPCAEGNPAPLPATNKSIERYLDCAQGFPVDTGDNSADFVVNATPNPGNLSGQYATACQPNQPNSGDGSGTIPTTAGPTCEGIVINELLPNPSGSDTGHEFIELYNPTANTISLDGCSLQTTASAKTYNFGGISLAAGAYDAFYDNQTGLTLPNGAGGTAWLLSPTEELQAITYPANMGDDIAWARFGDTWQATYDPTPNVANVPEVSAPCPAGQYRNDATGRCDTLVTASTLVLCKPDQVRNPLTNRCRSLLATEAGLQPCPVGKYRNPETNRCRSAASSSSLTPCKPGQTRNPATNRCRSNSTTSSSLKPCQTGWSRNSQTNRCRKNTTASVANIKDVNATTHQAPTWRLLIAGLIVAIALAYALYEWRRDLALAYDKLTSRLPKYKLPKK